MLTLVNPGDKVVIPEPTYSLYADHVAIAGGQIVWVPNRPDGSVDVARVSAELEGARMLALCSPSNPTGMVIPREDLQRLSDVARSADAYLLCDEAYSQIVFDDVPFTSALDLEDTDHVICCQTFSKTYAMTGWRLGYVLANEAVADAINLLHRTINGALSTFIQDAGIVALQTDQADLSTMASSYQVRRDMVVAELCDVPGLDLASPQGAFYAFVRFDGAETSDEVVERLGRAGVLVRSGSEFGPSGEGAFRISFATAADELAVGLSRIARAFTEDIELARA